MADPNHPATMLTLEVPPDRFPRWFGSSGCHVGSCSVYGTSGGWAKHRANNSELTPAPSTPSTGAPGVSESRGGRGDLGGRTEGVLAHSNHYEVGKQHSVEPEIASEVLFADRRRDDQARDIGSCRWDSRTRALEDQQVSGKLIRHGDSVGHVGR